MVRHRFRRIAWLRPLLFVALVVQLTGIAALLPAEANCCGTEPHECTTSCGVTIVCACCIDRNPIAPDPMPAFIAVYSSVAITRSPDLDPPTPDPAEILHVPKSAA
jgi:hypothetical protein